MTAEQRHSSVEGQRRLWNLKSTPSDTTRPTKCKLQILLNWGVKGPRRGRGENHLISITTPSLKELEIWSGGWWERKYVRIKKLNK